MNLSFATISSDILIAHDYVAAGGN